MIIIYGIRFDGDPIIFRIIIIAFIVVFVIASQLSLEVESSEASQIP